MISLDQVLLLEEKVESAVQKIAQLNAENDALRTKCAELTNALSEKSEQLSSFNTDQSKIEEGILKALDRLNSVENSVLKAAALTQSVSFQQNQAPVQSAPVVPAQTIEEEPIQEVQINREQTVPTTTQNTSEQNQPTQSDSSTEQKTADANGQFDIF